MENGCGIGWRRNRGKGENIGWRRNAGKGERKGRASGFLEIRSRRWECRQLEIFKNQKPALGVPAIGILKKQKPALGVPAIEIF